MANKNLLNSLTKYTKALAKEPDILLGDLGVRRGGKVLIAVPNRPQFVYVRLRTKVSELVEAFNDKVAQVYDLPVQVKREGNRYIVVGRNTEAYSDWATENPYIPKHAKNHSFDKDGGNFGVDPVWIYPYQFMPGLVAPFGSRGATNVFIHQTTVRDLDGDWKTVGNTGTERLTSYNPVSGSCLVLISIDTVSGNPVYYASTGTFIPENLTGTSQLLPYLSTDYSYNEVPDSFVRLISGTTSIGWNNLYDVRQFLIPHPTGTSGGGTNQALENHLSAGRLWGGEITDAGSGTVNIAAGGGIIKNDSAGLEDIPASLTDGQGSGWTLVSWGLTEGFSLAGEGYNLIYWDASAAAFAVQLRENFYANFDFTRDFTVGRVYYDGTSVVIRLCGMNEWNFPRRVQMFGEEVFPVVRARGLELSETGTRNIAITDGILWAELVNRFSVDGIDTSVTGTFSAWYRDGSGGWTEQASQTQINNTQYDDGDGTLVTLTANRYGVHWVYSCHDSSHHVVFGQGDYTLAQAELAQPPSILPGLIEAYATLIGKIIIQKSAAVFTAVESAFSTVFTPENVSEHNDLSGLQGGTTGQYYHLPASTAENNFAVGDGSGGWEIKTLAEVQALMGGSGIPTDGWIAGTGTWSYSSADAPTFVISVNNDQTALIHVGMRIKLTQTTAKYFIVTAVGTYGSGVTLITVYGGTDYTLANATITNPYISPVKAPFGFPLSPLKWTVAVTDTTQRSKLFPGQNTIYYSDLGSINISVPIGGWRLRWYGAIWGTGSGGNSGIIASLSTSNSAHNPDLQAGGLINVSTGFGSWGAAAESKIVLASKTSYYMVASTIYTGGQAIYFYNDYITMRLTAECIYL